MVNFPFSSVVTALIPVLSGRRSATLANSTAAFVFSSWAVPVMRKRCACMREKFPHRRSRMSAKRCKRKSEVLMYI